MKATSQSTISKSALVLGSAVAVAGLIAASPVQAATSGSSGQCNGQKMQKNSSTDSSMSNKETMKHQTNQKTGASGETAKPLSNQKGNQPITAPKTQ